MTPPKYKLRFWGTRGTIPTPDSEKLRFGGNTSCVSLSLDDREHIILDCGSGARLLGQTLVNRAGDDPSRYHIFFSHYHLDHVEGLALFPPLYEEKSRITILGPSLGGREPRAILESLVAPPYLPVTLADVPSKLDYVTLDGDSTVIRDITVNSLSLNHPGGCLSYRLERGERRIVYATDHEHGQEAIDRALIEFSRGADYLIYDSTYQPLEYEELRRGWGHSTWCAAVQMAIAAGVQSLILFHHHPDYTDDELTRVLRLAREEFPSTEISREGLELPI